MYDIDIFVDDNSYPSACKITVKVASIDWKSNKVKKILKDKHNLFIPVINCYLITYKAGIACLIAQCKLSFFMW